MAELRRWRSTAQFREDTEAYSNLILACLTVEGFLDSVREAASQGTSAEKETAMQALFREQAIDWTEDRHTAIVDFVTNAHFEDLETELGELAAAFGHPYESAFN